MRSPAHSHQRRARNRHRSRDGEEIAVEAVVPAFDPKRTFFHLSIPRISVPNSQRMKISVPMARRLRSISPSVSCQFPRAGRDGGSHGAIRPQHMAPEIDYLGARP